MSLRVAGPSLVDTSVWIDHFRSSNAELGGAIEEGMVLMHEFVLGELMLGAVPRGHEALNELAALPRAVHANHEDAMTLVRAHRLEGSGIGWVDAHLLASARLSGAGLWTTDRTLLTAAGRVGLAG